ncbi:MAG: four helix bundle protein [Armatimonadota bacterium]|nr:four helix bundle protein [Armatimonadota bacterium]
MNETELKERTKQFALRVMKLVDAIPNTVAGRALGNRLIRSGTSVGANYRAACRGRSKAEFIAKIGTVVEEADECRFWLELIMDGELMQHSLVDGLWKEADELTAIFVASAKTAGRSKVENQQIQIKNRKSEIKNA